MLIINKKYSIPSMKNSGFTLIELIVVIILLGIMAVTVAPKFFSSNGFEQYTYRNEVITTLRALQLRAMQQTDSNFCQYIAIRTTQIGLIKTDTTRTNNCHITDLADNNKEEFNKNTSVNVESNHDVTFSNSGLLNQLPSVFSFDQMGRVIDGSGNRVNCASTNTSPNNCRIIITSEDTLIIQIENEGYIHAL